MYYMCSIGYSIVYSMSEINKGVIDHDAYLTSLNTTNILLC